MLPQPHIAAPLQKKKRVGSSTAPVFAGHQRPHYLQLQFTITITMPRRVRTGGQPAPGPEPEGFARFAFGCGTSRQDEL